MGVGPLDWANEPWVKLYTRRTPETLSWPWQSRVVMDELLKVVDRSGQIGLGQVGVKGLALAIMLPLEVVEPGLAGLLEDGCVTQRNKVLTIENFIEAQEAPTSNKFRQQKLRDRRKALKSLDTTVTRRNGASRRNDRDESRLDESRLDESRLDETLEAHGQLPLAAPAPPAADLLVAKWNHSAAPEMPRCQKLTPARRKKATTLLRVVPLESWDTLIAMANGSEFLRGRTERGWRLSLSKMLEQPELALKVLEGNYSNGSGAPVKTAQSTQGFSDDRIPVRKLTQVELDQLMKKARPA